MKLSPTFLTVGFTFVALFCGRDLSANVTLPPVLDSHMVLQRESAVPIWGQADPGEQVTVTFRDQKKSTTTGPDGKWMIKLDPLPLGAPAELVVAGNNTLTLTDVLVGEVWVGSGQSNIDSPIPMYEKNDPVLKEAAKQAHPTLRLFRSARDFRWQPWDPKRSRGFSAHLFYFGVKLQEDLGVPVGLIEAAFAGSPSGPFISAEAFKSDPEVQKEAAASNEKEPIDGRMKKYEAAHAKWREAIATAKAAGAPTDKLKEPSKPVPFGQQQTGERYEKYIRPVIPFAIRGVLWDQGEGGSTGGNSQPVVMGALIRSWRKDWGQGDFPWLYVKKPSGGGCALDPNNPVNHGADAFQPLPEKPPASSYHSRLHHEGYSIAKNPNTFLVNTTDLAPGIHPANKSGYGTRSAVVALGAVYKKPIEYYGPVFESLKVEGDKLRITYTHVGKGLVVPEGQKLQGFLIAGEDKQFHWADAAIDGDTVVLSSVKVPSPVAARYAWTWPLRWANLFNKDGLPAFTFHAEAGKP
jgi:sialate O-acetylesterase